MEKKKIIKNVLKIVLIIIIVLVLILVVHTIRNYIIITDLQNKILQYNDSTNYYIKSISTENNESVVTMEYYKKDINEVVFLERNLNAEISKISIYNNGKRTDTFTETKDSKIAHLNRGTISINLYNHLETDNNWQTFLGCITSKIQLVDYNGKECYVIKGFMSSSSLTFEGSEIYIDKETGLLVKVTEAGTVSEREYEFDKVEDSIFIEPDISQYTLKENK